MRAFTIIDAPQRSAEWFAARAGRLTGSSSASMATLKGGGEPAARRDLRMKLALERLVGRSLEDDYINADMQRGIDLEPEARAAYEALTGELVMQTGFLAHTEQLMGCSLDGHIGDFDGILELKCPRPANHWKALKAGVMPAEHRYQVIHNMMIAGAQWADFCSYCPDFPAPLRLFRVRVERNEAEITSHLLNATLFLAEVEREYTDILERASQETTAYAF